MTAPQPGIVPEPRASALFLVLRVREPARRGTRFAVQTAGS